MVVISNIIRNGNIMSCDYYPEDKGKKGHVSVSLKTEEIIDVQIVPEFESEDYKKYAWKACEGMIELSEKDVLPKKHIVMWY